MAVVDFRSGGFQGAQNQRQTQDFPYGQDAPDRENEPTWYEEDWDDPQHADSHDPAMYEAAGMRQRLSRLTHYIGALVSVGLIIILAVWGFKLVVRDVSGVPVIRAVQGEARTAPENPGGELSDRMGLAVNGVAAGVTPGETDRVAIAPKATELEDQDMPMGALGATAQPPSRAVELPPVDSAARVIARPDSEPAVVEDEAGADSVANAVITDAPVVEAPVNEALTDLAGREPQDSAITQALAEAQSPEAAPPPPAVAQSARPAPRPRRVASAQPVAPAQPVASDANTVPVVHEARPEAASRPSEPAAEEPAAPAPAKVASGSSMAQIGAFDSDKLARGEWNRVSAKHGSIFAGKSMVVQEHKANGRTFWRLRAGGFASKEEARRFCAALIAQGVDCIPATAK